MKKLDRFAIYAIACFVALNNAYQMIGTEYVTAYCIWIGVACLSLGLGVGYVYFKN